MNSENSEWVTDLTGKQRDLVEWLRSEEADNPGNEVSSGLLGIAADEIERLRKDHDAS